MKKAVKIICGFLIAAALFVPFTSFAQEDDKNDKDKSDKYEKDKSDKNKKDVQQIIVTRKGDKGEKVVIEVNGDDIKINGKPLSEYKDKDGDISVKLGKFKDDLTNMPWNNNWNFNWNDGDNDNDNDEHKT